MSQPERDWIWAWLLLLNLRMTNKKIIRELSLAYAMELDDGVDYVRQGRVIGIRGGEEDLQREFVGFLKDLEKS